MAEPDRSAVGRESLERITAALQVAVRALVGMADSSREARAALDTIEHILSDGREDVRRA